jgi:hypothetical protein
MRANAPVLPPSLARSREPASIHALFATQRSISPRVSIRKTSYLDTPSRNDASSIPQQPPGHGFRLILVSRHDRRAPTEATAIVRAAHMPNAIHCQFAVIHGDSRLTGGPP